MFLWEVEGLVKISLEVCSLDQNFFRSRQDWPEFHQKQAGSVRIPSGAGKTSRFLWELAGLVKIILGACRIDQNSFGSRQNRSVSLRACRIGQNVLKRKQDLSEFLSKADNIGQHFFGSQQDWSEFLRELVDQVRIPLGTDRSGIFINTFVRTSLSNVQSVHSQEQQLTSNTCEYCSLSFFFFFQRTYSKWNPL